MGWQVAERIGALHLPGTEVRMLQQLQIEQAAEWAAFDRVVVVDASVEAQAVRLEPVLEPSGVPSASTHALSASTLLALVRMLYMSAPEVWVCAIPASDFAFGAALSARTRDAVAEAVIRLHGLLAPPQSDVTRHRSGGS